MIHIIKENIDVVGKIVHYIVVGLQSKEKIKWIEKKGYKGELTTISGIEVKRYTVLIEDYYDHLKEFDPQEYKKEVKKGLLSN